MFKNLKRKHPYIYYILVGAALIMFWRGIWGLLDIYLLPQNTPLSFMISIVLGLALLLLTHALGKLS